MKAPPASPITLLSLGGYAEYLARLPNGNRWSSHALVSFFFGVAALFVNAKRRRPDRGFIPALPRQRVLRFPYPNRKLQPDSRLPTLPIFRLTTARPLDILGSMKLSSYMQENGLSDAKLAVQLGICSASAVAKWRQGNRVPRTPMIIRLRQITEGKVTADDFVPITPHDDPHPPPDQQTERKC